MTGAYRVDFFRSTACNAGAPNDYGEGEAYLGSQTLNAATTGGVGLDNTLFSAPAGSFITTTVTFNGNTSEFSQCRLVTAGAGGAGTTSVSVTPSSMPAGGFATVTVTITGPPAQSLSVDSITATLPAGYSFVRNSTRIDGSYIDDGMDNEPPSLGGALVWPRALVAPWPITVPAGGSRSFSFQINAPNNASGALPLNVSVTTQSGNTVTPSSTEIRTLASAPGTLVLPVNEDTWVDQGNPTASHGSEGSFDVQGGNNTQNNRWKGLLKFNLGSIPDGMTVTGATLRLGTTTGFSYNGDVNHYAVVVPDGWSEDSVTWNTRPSDGFTGTIPCTFGGATPADVCDAPASVLTAADPDFLGGGDVFYGLAYGTPPTSIRSPGRRSPEPEPSRRASPSASRPSATRTKRSRSRSSTRAAAPASAATGRDTTPARATTRSSGRHSF